MGRRLRHKRRIDQRPFHGIRKITAYGEHIRKLHGHLSPENLLWRNLEFLAEIFLHLRLQLFRCLQAHYSHPAPLMERLFHQKPEIFCYIQRFIIRCDICISRHTDIISFRHLILVKDQIQILQDHLFHTDITDIMPRQIKHL